MTPQRRNSVRHAAFAALAVVLVTMMPQTILWIARGGEWNGAYALMDTDEQVYSAYLNAIVQGKPRRNDPYFGNQAPEHTTRHETYFSIQFLPPYAAAFLARLLRTSASTTFIILTPLLALASSLAVFWLLLEFGADSRTAAIGVLFVLLCGVLASANLLTTGNYYGVFSFLRRYIPAIPFPLFFVFCVFVWRALVEPSRKYLGWAFSAGVVLWVLVYSYFYLWTTAGAWLLAFLFLGLVFRKELWNRVLKVALLIGAMAVAALVPYVWMLSHRAKTIDSDQALVLTHRPDLFQMTEILGAVIAVVLIFGYRKGVLTLRSPAFLFAGACAITPFIVLNQQIITGRSLQPFHYEQFILNYLLMATVVILDGVWWKQFTKRSVWWVGMSIVIGISLAAKATTVYLPQNKMIDLAIPLFHDLEVEALESRGSTILIDQTLLSASAPTYSNSLHLLWSPYTYTYGSIDQTENHERAYQYFYYLGVTEEQFRKLLPGHVYGAAIFGLHRVNAALVKAAVPISQQEIEAEVSRYSNYSRNFSVEQAHLWPLSHVVLAAGVSYDLSNLDRWYERDSGEKVGDAIVHRVRLRSR